MITGRRGGGLGVIQRGGWGHGVGGGESYFCSVTSRLVTKFFAAVETPQKWSTGNAKSARTTREHVMS